MNELVQDKMAQGVELMALENHAGAKEVFAEVVTLDPRCAEGYLNLGNACACLDQIDEAISSFKKALLLEGDNADALYSLGCSYFIKGDYASAVRNFNKVEDLGAATVEMYGILMAMFVDSDDPAMALRCANKAIRLAPLNGSLRVQKAQIYIALGQFDEAIVTLHELQEVLPDEAEGYAAEVEVQIESGKFDDAIASLDRALTRFPKDASLYALKARVLNTVARYDDALAAAETGIKLNDTRSTVVSELGVQRGVALGGLNRVEDSLRAFEESVGKNGSERAEVYFLMLNECIVLKEFDKALEYADVLLSMEDAEKRTVAFALYAKPFALEQKGQRDEALNLYREAAVELRRITISNPGLFEVHGYRVMCHKALGEYDEALELANHIISLDESDAAAYALKRDVLLAMGNDKEAEKLRLKALSLNPNFSFGE